MREFRDERGAVWVASVQEGVGDDYKGRFCFAVSPKDGPQGATVSLEDIRWNSANTAERTLRTMSEMELRRRLRIARGRDPQRL